MKTPSGDRPQSSVTVAAQNAKLEAALIKDPTDLSAASVYADWLQARGDPRGQLAALQIASVTATDAAKTKLARAESNLFAANGDAFVPRLIAEVQARHLNNKPKKKGRLGWQKDAMKLDWSAGFVSSLRLAVSREEDATAAELLEAFLAHPSSRLLRNLEVALNISNIASYAPLLAVLSRAKLPALRRLFVAELVWDTEFVPESNLAEFSSVWKAAPNLESVIVNVPTMNFNLGPITLAKARSFEVGTHGLSGENFNAIASATWPELSRLVVTFGLGESSVGLSAEMLEPFLDSPKIAKVTDLGLTSCEYVDELCAILVKSKIAKRLERLDLSMGNMSDVGAEALVTGAKAFPKLRELNVDGNFISEAGLESLEEVAEEVLSEDQEPAEDWGVY